MDKKNILILTGSIDFQISGNQTLKQTVKYFAKEYRVRMLSFTPSQWANLDTDFGKDIKDLQVSRLPVWIKIPFSLYVWIQERIFKRKQKDALRGNFTPTDVLEFFGYNSKLGLILPNLATFLYILLEFPRAFYCALTQRPKFIYGYEKEGALLGAIIGRLTGIPVIKRFQGTQLTLKNGRIAHRLLLISLVLSHKIFNCPVVMANDGTPGDEILNALKIHENNFLFIMNGLVTEHLYGIKDIDIQSELGIPKNARIILMLSTLWMWKRIDRGIFLIKKLHEFKRGEDYYLVIIGEGNARDYLQSLTKKLGVETRVRFLGALPHQKALEYLKACDVLWSFFDISNLGNSLLEAIYLEKPVITIRNKHIEALFGKDSPNLVGIEELEKVVELTLRVIEDDMFRKILIEKAHFAKKSLLSWEERMEREINWIEEKIKARASH